MYQRILVAIDGSRAARRALDEAIQLASAQQAALCLAHIMEMPFMYDGVNVDFTALAEARAGPGRILLAEASVQVRQAGIAPEVVLGSTDGGKVGDAIVAEANRWPADLIVLGTHGHGLFDKLLGSTTEDVLRSTPVPILLVRG